MSVSADSLNRRGVELYLQGDLDGSKIHYLAALRTDPAFLPAAANLVDVLSQQNFLTSAIALAKRLVTLAPHNGDFNNMVGNLLTRMERYSEAEEYLLKASALMPDSRAPWHNLGLLYHRSDRWDEALKAFDTVVEMGGDSMIVQNDQAHILLAMGELEKGLEKYEARWHDLVHLPSWDFHIPEWAGQDLAGKSLLFHGEQGLGDTIMASRFWKELAQLGAKVTLGVPRSMVDLYESQGWPVGILAIDDMNESNMRFDYQTPMYSALRWLNVGRDSIESKPYLIAPKITVPDVYMGVWNVGICWASGRRGGRHDWRRRVSPLDLWLSLAELPNVQLWSLFKNDGSTEIADLGAEALIVDPTPKLNTIGETAAFVDKLDVVITVDTMVAHLAAAMGKRTWMLSQFSHCWRWWDLKNGTGRPWYDTMTIINQDKLGNWKTQLEICKHLLTSDINLMRAA